MPYVNDQNLKKYDETQDTQDPTLAGTADAAGGDFGGAAGKPAPAGPTSSGRFVNLQGYLNANAGQNFGGQVADKVQGTVDQANQAQTDASSQFTSRVDQNAVQADPNLVSEATNTPTQVTNDPAKMAAWNKQYNASYAGPQSFADAQDLYKSTYGQAEAAKSAADASKSEGGRFGLLDRYFGRPTYTQGEKTLDNLLVQNDTTAQPKFQQAQAGAQQAANNFGDLQNRLTAYANQAAGQTQQAKEAAHKALGVDMNGNLATGGAYEAYTKGLDAKAKQLNEKAGGDYTTQSGIVSTAAQMKDPSMLARYGIGDVEIPKDNSVHVSPATFGLASLFRDPSGTNRFWGVDPTSYLHRGVEATSSNVVGADDLSKLTALNSLAGHPVMEQALGGYDPTKAVTFDTQAFDTARKQQMSTYQQDLASALNGNLPGGDIRTPEAQAYIRQLYAKYGI